MFMKKRYAEAFAITKIRTFKHEPFFIVGVRGGELIRGTLQYFCMHHGLDQYVAGGSITCVFVWLHCVVGVMSSVT